MNSYLLEVCCGSVEDVLQAERGGADRVELNSSLFHGGLTPSIGELITAKRLSSLPVMTMVRPRQAGFCYTDAEYQTALADAEKLLEYGSDTFKTWDDIIDYFSHLGGQ
jgi:copper homeostasis protein